MGKIVRVEDALGMLCKKGLKTTIVPSSLFGKTVKIRMENITAFSKILSIAGVMNNTDQGRLTLGIQPVVVTLEIGKYIDLLATAKAERETGHTFKTTVCQIHDYSFSKLFFDFEENEWSIQAEFWPMSELMIQYNLTVAYHLKGIDEPHPLQPLMTKVKSTDILPIMVKKKVGVVLWGHKKNKSGSR